MSPARVTTDGVVGDQTRLITFVDDTERLLLELDVTPDLTFGDAAREIHTAEGWPPGHQSWRWHQGPLATDDQRTAFVSLFGGKPLFPFPHSTHVGMPGLSMSSEE